MGRSPCFAGNSPSLLVELLVVAPTRSLRSLDKVVPIEKPVSLSLCVCRTASVASTIFQVNQL